ncbi:MAG: cell wall metabolism sensor histidine kinase WalK, partial [Actinomycetota bacterium]|nr:cell wall metabolism sensor histidine kinase WalK [Actinomycetota bacterium]
LSVMALAAARVEHAMRRLAGAALLIAVAEALTASVPGEVYGTGDVDSLSYLAHGLRVGGYLLLGAWLWTGIRSSIRTRFVASFVALLVAVVLGLSTALTGVISSNVERNELERVKEQARATARSIQEGEVEDLLEVMSATTGNPQTEAQIVAKMRAGNDRLAGELAEVLPAADFVIVDPSDSELSSAGDEPMLPMTGRKGPKGRTLGVNDAVTVMGTQVAEDCLAFRTLGGLERAGGWLVILAGKQFGDPENPAGCVVAGQWIDAFAMEALSNRLRPTRASLVVNGQTVASRLPASVPRGRLIPRLTRADIETTGEAASAQQTLGERSFYSGFAALERPNGDVIGEIVLSSPAEIVSQTREGVTRILFVVAMAVGAIAMVLAWLSGRRITRPIQQLTATAGRVREGDLSAQASVAGEDEVGRLGETFNEMTASLVRMTDDLRAAAVEESRLRSRIETIMQSMADGLVAVDGDKRVLAFNREAESLTGLTARQVIGKPVEKVLEARDPQGEPVRLPIFDLAEGAVGGVTLKRKGGDPVPVAVTSAVLRGDGGQVAGGVAVVRDMTREREVEKMKSEFLSNISHELRTPLTPIKGYAEILSRKEVPAEKSKQFVKGILDSTARLERIVELLVDFSAMEAGRLAPRSTPIDLGEVVAKLAAEWEKKTPRHEVVAEVSDKLPQVVGDERLIRRSIEEVLDNAVKFSPHGGTIRLEARTATSTTNGRRRQVEVCVSDQGIGITPEDLPKVFSDFHQLDGSETRAYGGLGLGLAFVQRIVEAHAGTITVESEPDQGTTFTISIPAARRGRKPAGN